MLQIFGVLSTYLHLGNLEYSLFFVCFSLGQAFTAGYSMYGLCTHLSPVFNSFVVVIILGSQTVLAGHLR
ncbi:hypothetical protein AZE42_13279 [Rhizopogon vesiculosus]|uniref:Uncharacterized protein n=1 Tax=Rhizopogon vesiculosus TaxID=180088 RepID=A0A1J8QV80_9AGAM|nr:hypothetical protein AZE42_13279 [Rhizopogon vesiculosus]